MQKYLVLYGKGENSFPRYVDTRDEARRIATLYRAHGYHVTVWDGHILPLDI